MTGYIVDQIITYCWHGGEEGRWKERKHCACTTKVLLPVSKTSVVAENQNAFPRDKMFLKELKRCLAVLRDHAVLTARTFRVRKPVSD
jgi:hypothetical protein